MFLAQEENKKLLTQFLSSEIATNKYSLRKFQQLEIPKTPWS